MRSHVNASMILTKDRLSYLYTQLYNITSKYCVKPYFNDPGKY